MTDRGRPRVGLMVLVRGFPGHPLHPPLTDATIGMYVLAGALAVIGYAGAIKPAAGKGMWLALFALAAWRQYHRYQQGGVTAAGLVLTPCGVGALTVGSWLGGARIRPPLIFAHMLLAATGLVLWIVYLASGTRSLAWVAFALLLVIASLGFGMLALWLQRRQTTAATGSAGGLPSEDGLPAEQHFPVALVGGHGVLASTTLVVVLLAALKVGGS